MKKTIIAAMAVVALAGVSNADVLFSSDFDGNTFTDPAYVQNASGSSTASVTWTKDVSVTSVSDLTVISPAGGFTRRTGSTFITADVLYLNHNLNIADRANPRGYSLTFTTDTSWNLTDLSIISGHGNNDGNTNQDFTSDLTYSLSGGTLGSAVTGTKNVDYTGPTLPLCLTTGFDLTGTTIGAGTYTMEVTMNNLVGGGAYAVFDGITLEAIPEPATLGMVVAFGGGLLLMRRKLMM